MSSTENSTVASHQEQLDRALAEVQALREQLRRAQRLATVGTMTAMVAHEFNNILTPIINYAQMARTNPKLADKAIAKAADGGQRASHICKAILGMTHESQTSTCESLAELVADALAAMAREPQKDGIELSVNVPADLSISTRRVELQQVLVNLLVNARNAVLAKNRGGRRIEISAQKADAQVFVRIADTGVGIDPRNLQKIFQPFFTTGSVQSGSDQGGHGLGLAICQEIVTALGGNISVQSTLGEGATFTLRLPA